MLLMRNVTHCTRCHASENNLRAFSATVLAIVAESVVRAAASFATVCLTHEGSLRFPRFGTGARYGESDSASRRSSGTSLSRSSSVHFLNVTIPLKDTYHPDSTAELASSCDPV